MKKDNQNLNYTIHQKYLFLAWEQFSKRNKIKNTNSVFKIKGKSYCSLREKKKQILSLQ